MSVSLISSQTTTAFEPTTDSTKQNKMEQEFKALSQALQSGNLSAAQQSFATIQANAPTPPAGSSSSTASGTGTSSTSSTNGPSADFQALAKALSAGDIAAAQTAFAKLQKYRPQGPPPGGPPPDRSDSNNTDSTSSSSTSTSALVNVLA